ncbi:MAG: acyl-ACP desaturase [Vicinamibacterales bacterium]
MHNAALHTLHRELSAERVRCRHIALLSPDARALAIERGLLALYRWYTVHSQQHRNWHPDTCVDWRTLRRDHGDEVHTIVEGFFAVEQYTPDYVLPLLGLVRRAYGRAQWHMRWGAEEAKHADLWRNTVLSLGRRSEAWMDACVDRLRGREWHLPWDAPLHMVFYQVIQERATQISYLNLGLAARGQLSRLPESMDATLARVCRLITIDEAAHYHFFTEVARLLLYYDPDAAVAAFADVLRHFSMPARDLVPDYDVFGRVLHATGVFGRTVHYRDVVQPVLAHLSLPAVRAIEEGVRRAREIPGEGGVGRTSAFLDVLDLAAIEARIQSLLGRTAAHLDAAGLSTTADLSWQRAWRRDEPVLPA